MITIDEVFSRFECSEKWEEKLLFMYSHLSDIDIEGDWNDHLRWLFLNELHTQLELSFSLL